MWKRRIKVKLVRHGECNRCGDCCRVEELKIPWLWDGEKCIYLEGNTCTVWGTDKLPWYCRLFPQGTEHIIEEKMLRGERLDFKSLLPNCTFRFMEVSKVVAN